jgi:hypothetical protein
VLEKLGAYTVGSIKGTERRRIRAHLVGCPSCAAMHDELRDVCSGLRAHAALLAVPLAAAGTGLAATVKGVLASAKAQVALVASASTVIGVLGIVAGPWGPNGSSPAALDDFDGKRGVELIITGMQPAEPSVPETIALTTGSLGTSAVVPNRRNRGAGQGPTSPDPDAPTPNGPTGGAPAVAGAYDENAPVVYRQTNITQRSEGHGDYLLIYETTSVTQVNSADQTKTTTTTRNYTKPATFGATTSTGNPRSQEVPSESVKPTSGSTESVGPTTTTTTARAPKPTATNPR